MLLQHLFDLPDIRDVLQGLPAFARGDVLLQLAKVGNEPGARRKNSE